VVKTTAGSFLSLEVNVTELITEIQMLYKNRKYQCTETYQFKLNVKDEIYDACKTANINDISGRESLPSGL
jgi:hypothetical protein